MKRRKFINRSTSIASGLIFANSYLRAQTFGFVDGRSSAEEKEIVGIDVFVPSQVRLGEEFWVGVKIKCKPFFADWSVRWERVEGAIDGPFNKCARGTTFMDNVRPDCDETITISGSEGFEGLSSYSFEENNDRCYGQRGIRRFKGFRFNKSGFKYVVVEDEKSGIKGMSNPIFVDENNSNEKLFWGDLHCHSFFGDGIRAPEELHGFARDETFLDIFALTDHTEIISDGQWEYFKYVSNNFNEPYRFVTFNGGEWTSISKEFGTAKYGHHNFIYPGDDGPILRSNDIECNNLEKLFSITRLHGGLIIANHPGSAGWGFDWNHNYKDDVVRLVEVYNGGSHEADSGAGHAFKSLKIKNPNKGNYAVDGLKKGLKFGMIGVGDTHDGRPGDQLHSLQNTPGYSEELGPGLTGVWAEALTRESIFKALYDRRVFATTNNRTWLKFSINDEPMGSELETVNNLKVKIIAASNMDILIVELIKKGEVAKSYEPISKTVDLEFKLKCSSDSVWYYVRLTMNDNHFAWSSPIWINS